MNLVKMSFQAKNNGEIEKNEEMKERYKFKASN